MIKLSILGEETILNDPSGANNCKGPPKRKAGDVKEGSVTAETEKQMWQLMKGDSQTFEDATLLALKMEVGAQAKK